MTLANPFSFIRKKGAKKIYQDPPSEVVDENRPTLRALRADQILVKKYTTESGRVFCYTHRRKNVFGYIDGPDQKPVQWYIKNEAGVDLLKGSNLDYDQAFRDLLQSLEGLVP